MDKIIPARNKTEGHLPSSGGKGFPHNMLSGTGHDQLMSEKGGGHCTWRGDRLIHWFHNWRWVISGTVFAFLALGVLVWVHTEGIDGILHGTEALVECQVLTVAQVLRDQHISWICIIETGRTSELVLSGMGCKYGWSKEMLHFQVPYVFLPALPSVSLSCVPSWPFPLLNTNFQSLPFPFSHQHPFYMSVQHSPHGYLTSLFLTVLKILFSLFRKIKTLSKCLVSLVATLSKRQA